MADQPYSGDPLLNSLSAVRFLLGDTTEPFLLHDDEVSYLTTEDPNPFFAAALGADILASRYVGQANRTVGDLSISYNRNRAEEYRELAKSLRERANDPRINGVPVPYAGGQTVTDKLTDRSDPDRVLPYFRTGGMGGPGSDPRELSSDVAIDQTWRGNP